MIAWLSGKVRDKKPTSVVIDAGGVGYLVHISLPTFYTLPDEGGGASLHIHTNVKEDSIQLFGFATTEEQAMFDMLIGVNKVGPKMALTILSGMPVEKLLEAVRGKDVARLSAVPGIGKKTAERIIVELSDKAGAIEGAVSGQAPVSSAARDAVDALLSLGYKRAEAEKAVDKACEQGDANDVESVIKRALSLG